MEFWTVEEMAGLEKILKYIFCLLKRDLSYMVIIFA